MGIRRIRPMAVVLAVVAIAGLAVPPTRSAVNEKKAETSQDTGQATSLADLFRIGYDLCQQGQYDMALWPLKRAANLARNDPGVQLWYAHALIQTGQLREGKNKLVAAERILAGTRRNTIPNASVYLACVRNYLGLAAALDHSNSEALVWFRKAIELPPKATAAQAAPAGRNRQAAGNTIASEKAVAQAAEANKRLLESRAPFAWWVAPDEPLPGSEQLRKGPGLAGDYAKAANNRWRRAVAPANTDRDPSPAGDGQADDRSARIPRDGKTGGRTVTLSVPPVVVTLLDSTAALTQARALAQIGNLNEALRLADASRAMQPGVADAYLVQADLFEAKGWLLEALDALDTAAAKAAGEQKQIARDRAASITKGHAELRLEPRGLLTSKHFRLRFSVPPDAAQATLTHLERVGNDALRTFGVELPVVYVRLFSDTATFQAYVKAIEKEPPAAWLYGRAITSMHSPGILVSATAGLPTLSHEYAHLVTRSLAGAGEVPHWLDEGIADVVKLGRAVTTDHVRAAFVAGRLPRAEDVEKFFSDAQVKRAADNEVATLFYDVSRCAVSFLLNSCGDQIVVEWLLLIRRGDTARQSFQNLTGLTWERFFLRWMAACLELERTKEAGDRRKPVLPHRGPTPGAGQPAPGKQP